LKKVIKFEPIVKHQVMLYENFLN